MAGGREQPVTLDAVTEFIENLFETKDNPRFREESGLTVHGRETVKTVGYCTNLTLAAVAEAVKNDIDLMITHHDAWDFIFGLKEACQEKLKAHGISHYFNHLPLDDCDFGTNSTLMAELGAEIVAGTNESDGFFCGRVGELREEITLRELAANLSDLLGEVVLSWRFNDEKIKRAGLVCGGGGSTCDVKEAVDRACHVYITGEKTLYTVEYAQYAGINLIVGSHTFMEIFCVASLAEKIKEKWRTIKIVKLAEEHLEALPLISLTE